MLRFAALMGLLTLAACGSDSRRVVLPPEGLTLDSTGSVPRHFRDDSLVLVASIGGSENDTALIDPYLLEAADHRAYIVEGDQRVQAYDTLATRLWATGREGGGPGEFRNIRDIKVAPNREIWVNDPSNTRITRLDSTGTVLGAVSLERVGHSETIVPGSNMTVTLMPAYADADIMTIDTTGTVIDRDTIPWAGFHELERLSKQFHTASDPVTGRWAMGFTFGNGWFGIEGRRISDRRYYVEPTLFPAVIKDVSNGGATISSQLVRGDLSGANIALKGDTLFVLFGGKERFRQTIDLYNWTSGTYLGSIALPESVDDIALGGQYLYTLASHPVPRFVVYRRVGRGRE
jgi:hypothetical protein